MPFASFFDKELYFLFALIATLVSIFTLAGFIGRLWWVFDLFSHFRVQYCLILLSCALIFGMGRKEIAASLSGFFALVNLSLIAPLYIKRVPDQPGKRTYRVLLSNVLQHNHEYSKAVNFMRATNPDMMILVEVNQAWIDRLEPIRAELKYCHASLREDNYGVALLSRFPFEKADVHYFGEAQVPTVIARLQLGGKELTLIGTHPPPPKGRLNAAYRNQQMRELATYTASQAGHIIFGGDLNLTPWSTYYHDFLRQSGLRDSRQGFGVQASWPADRPYVRVPIDQIFVSRGINIHSRRLGPAIGSDHYPVILEFSFE